MNITARIIRITEDEQHAALTFKLTTWEAESHETFDDPDDIEARPAEPGEPGAWWTYSLAPEFTITLPRSATHRYDVGRSYVLDLREIIDAPINELEDA